MGDTLELAGTEAGARLAVTVTQVVDRAEAANQFSSPSPGQHLVAVQFRLHNIGTSDYSDSPDNSAQLIDTSGQDFNTAITDSTTAGPAFPGIVHLAPGDTALGFITFQIPDSSTVAKVQFTPASGFANQTGQWAVTATAASSGSTGSPSGTGSASGSDSASASASATDPQQVVTDYFAAINAHDFTTAWALGGKNLSHDYESFVAGFATTSADTVTVTGSHGGTVTVSLDATQTDGSHRLYTGSYTVQDGVITSGDVQQQ
ncbi:DUF4352 domain-containing protein [Kitasatospora sp. NBC_01287]|uniref:DUF4352 domain-containing protein n=1 Tax=Kitasatospora sp. NBC_01287 TaxID=2903573 RepID=UPI002256AF42|nr:DUF4352 domain-containing protein [Kitasatospora sp. NBC_01287]MCX4746035.1 DUF4352 domain-containing protein [Kitasatospora sp. NBC_01287]